MSDTAEDKIPAVAAQLMAALDDPDIAGRGEIAKLRDPLEELRTDLFGFFKSRIERIGKSEKLKEKIQDALEAMVDEETLNFDQLESLFRTVAGRASQDSESLLALFRPVPGVSSPLIDSMARKMEEGGDNIDKVFGSMRPEDLEALDRFYRIFEKYKAESARPVTPGAPGCSE